jgi:hypothetical protein
VRRHLAVVPVSELDAHTAWALLYAGSLAPEVIAMHVRVAGPRGGAELERLWRTSGRGVPLVVVDAPAGGRAAALRQALAILQRTEQADRISVVVPWHPDPAGHELGLDDLAGSPAGRSDLVIHHAPAAS